MSVQVPVTHDIAYLSPRPGLPTRSSLEQKQKPTVVKLVYTITNKASIKPGVRSLLYIAQVGGTCGRFSPYSCNQSCFLLKQKAASNIPVRGARPGVPHAKVGIWSTLSSSFMAFCTLLFFAYLVDLASFILSLMLGFCTLGIELPIEEVAKFDFVILPIFTTHMVAPTCRAKHSHNHLHPYMHCPAVSGSDGTSTQATQYFSATSGSALLPSLDTDTNIQSSASSGNTQLSLVNLEARIISIVQRHLADFQGLMDEKFCDDIDFWNHAEVHEKGRASFVLTVSLLSASLTAFRSCSPT
ncbi:hypothetical protein BKA82DRAFT_4010547 [Pisolithus tinctorius]|nr:hypothetical protein BKA82DRAFT_4010547 [Pisolithus tinctorius]